MARNPKMFIHDAVYELCFRIEEGLPMTAAPFMKRIIKGYLAAAQSRHPVTICHYIVMANHIHMLVMIKNPEDLSRFVLYFKRESAHAINTLLGRRNRTVWAERYDSPVLLDAGKVIERIVYFYANPAQAGLT
ncbi:MAG: transposase, partial [bacterium]|nr:transposase [bacterium]